MMPEFRCAGCGKTPDACLMTVVVGCACGCTMLAELQGNPWRAIAAGNRAWLCGRMLMVALAAIDAGVGINCRGEEMLVIAICGTCAAVITRIDGTGEVLAPGAGGLMLLVVAASACGLVMTRIDGTGEGTVACDNGCGCVDNKIMLGCNGCGCVDNGCGCVDGIVLAPP